MAGGEKKVERKATMDRKDALIRATLKCLSEEGYDGLSIRKISAEAGVSVGLINHHYASKEELVAQAYEHMTLSHFDVIKVAVAEADPDPRSQLRAFNKSMVAVVSDPGVLRSWVVFWGMTQPGNSLYEIHHRTYAHYRALLEGILRRFAEAQGVPLLDIRLAAIGLLGLLDGLWIVQTLNPEVIRADEAVRLADTWVDSLIYRAASTAGVPVTPQLS